MPCTGYHAHMGDEHAADAGVLTFESHIAWLQLILAVVVGGAFLFFCLGIPYLSDEQPGGFETFVAACVTPLAIAVAGFRRSLVVDRAAGTAVRRMGWFCIQRTKRFPLAAFDRVEVRSSTVDHDAFLPQSKRRLSSQSTSYPVHLAGPGVADLMLTTSSSRDSSLEEATRIAQALGLPVHAPT